MEFPAAINRHIEEIGERLTAYPALRAQYANSYAHTAKTAVIPCEDGTYHILTGDIPAMWLRDSSAQVSNYLGICDDPEIADLIEGTLKRQMMFITIDPYANAFNQEPNGEGHTDDLPRNHPWVFERKYEIDSLCYPMRLLYLFWKKSGRTALIASKLEEVARVILDVWETEQHHAERSPYRFIRPHPHVPWDTIPNEGKGTPVAVTGMTWSGFRPSDDGCEYGYLTASEMFASVVLGYMSEMLREVCRNAKMADECLTLKAQIEEGIWKYCVVEHPRFGKIFACETDGMGHYTFMDDANVPSLLSIPYIGFLPADNEIYRNTRSFLLSDSNPYYFKGKYATGIGSRHTPKGYIWHLALAMQGLTATDPKEKRELLDMIVRTDGGTGYLHEGFDADDPKKYTREWFTWPNSVFSEFVEQCLDEGIL